LQKNGLSPNVHQKYFAGFFRAEKLLDIIGARQGGDFTKIKLKKSF
jgi:hypothetical protein